MAHPFIKHLVEDHQKQRPIAKQLKKATEPKVRASLRQEMADEVLPHMAGEEASIFAHMRGSDNAKAAEHALDPPAGQSRHP
ncbi:MAG: hemerythrin domain-containing protein [Coriobacteriia bacterium]|nr:hemerythrin domain-containing protein [Coriobacteriia bacterium]